MSKPSVQVQLIHAQREIARLRFELANARLVSTRFCADAACIAAHHVFQRTGPIMADFMEKYLETVQEIAQMMIDDSATEYRDGEYLEYGKHKVDEAVKADMTEEFFLPFDQRHMLGKSDSCLEKSN